MSNGVDSFTAAGTLLQWAPMAFQKITKFSSRTMTKPVAWLAFLFCALVSVACAAQMNPGQASDNIIKTNRAGAVFSESQSAHKKFVVSILGSSVAQGWKAPGLYDHQSINGSCAQSYGADLTRLEAPLGWQVVNQSIPGDDTPRVIRRFDRDEVPVGADEDLIALSLGNEGLPGAAHPLAIYDQFFRGITNLIAMSRAHNILPLLGDGYPRDSYTPKEYALLKKMELKLNVLNVPSVNFLGATDDGHGHWVKNSFINLGAGDGIHPNGAGHYEMFLTIVPSVFAALEAGKPTPQWGQKSRCLRITNKSGDPSPLTFKPSLIMHSFTLSFRVRSDTTGTVASVLLPDSSEHCTVEITPAGLAYVGTNGAVNCSDVAGTNGAWHEIVVAHQYARGLTWFYVDDKLIATVSERLTPVGFVLGGPGGATKRPASPAQAEYQNWFVYRSLLNAEEVSAQFHGLLQQASLELYAPLDDNSFVQGRAIENRAQSFSAAFITAPSASFESVSALPAMGN
jgi:lysophospholipase L1-like esterase